MAARWTPQPATEFFIGRRAASQAQIDKYNKILEAAYELADKGGYDALQMRAVSDVSGVALATIYRYFKSRDYLAYILGISWIAQVVGRHGLTPEKTSSLRALRRTIYASAADLKEHPNMLQTFTRSMLTSDPLVGDDRRHITATFSWGAPKGVRQKDWETMTYYMDLVYWAGLLRWTYGQKDYEGIARDVDGVATMAVKALEIFK
ncbi:TetR family transcriptional regulator [Frankia sp. AgKG'84/4]|uniref:TetR family transcriptional regulator n=1 Tax=Frankia sp. AgKG'84/4 TaxID=573490 RepID=UPI0020101F27|nr:TetR family transcriptional regulator [Frankia sp. AgKG'84/4]MCL9793182.1 TetR family transcriptional regulator [Frankia sp. AgKG'84/4]